MALRKINLINRIQILVATVIFVGVAASSAMADDVFALAPGTHDNLIVFGPKGDRVTELTVPTISQSVTVGSTTFQVSYGRDANNYLTAILAPSANQPQNLHFTVLNKTVETSKDAVVTLTFPSSRQVIVDPGYVGSVSVNSRQLRHRDLADSAPVVAPSAPAPRPTPSVTTASLSPAPAPRPSMDVQPRDVPQQPAPAPVHHTAVVSDPVPVSQPSMPTTDTSNQQIGGIQPSILSPPPLMGSLQSQPIMPTAKGLNSAKMAPTKELYWAEPITPPGGPAPMIGIDQMKLEAVHGPVEVKLPDGDTKTGSNGMIVPSGSSIVTSENSSAAVFMGGVDSARLLPNTEASVSQKLNGSTRTTNVNVKTGTIFSRVGHRPGETQDYEVRTPEGVAAARGTSFAVSSTTANGQHVTIVATEEGVVTLTDASTGHVITITPNGSAVSIGSVPGLPSRVLRTIFTNFMLALQQFNTNMQAIASNPNPTPAEQAYFNANSGFADATQFYNANAGAIEVLYLTNRDVDLIDQVNGIYYVVPNARRGLNQILEPFGNVPITPY